MVISVASVKGGTGKTATAHNLGAAIAKEGKKVLLVDNDSQGNLTKSLGKTPADQKRTLSNLMGYAIDEPDILAEMVGKTVQHHSDNLDFIPSNRRLSAITTRLAVMQTSSAMTDDEEIRSEFVLREVISNVRDQYDYIIIDCSNNRDLQMINALVASDGVIIPVQAHFLDAEGLPDTLAVVKAVNKLNPDLKVLGILLTMFRSQTNLAKGVRDEIVSMYGNAIPVFDAPIAHSVRVAEAPAYGESILEYDPANPASTAYIQAALEVIKHG